MRNLILKRCCIIGGAGFIGIHVVKSLLNTDREIIVIGRSQKSVRPLSKAVKYYSGDCYDFSFIKKIVCELDEVIFSKGSNIINTSDYQIGDILYELNQIDELFKILNSTKIKKIIVITSGGTIYGNTQQLPINENCQCNPISPYGLMNLCIERIGLFLFNKNGFPVIFARPSNVYGEEQIPFTGQGFISTGLASIIQGKELIVYGKNGTIRDYVHVKDVAIAIQSLLKDGVIGQSYNIASGTGFDNFQILQIMKETLNIKNKNIKLKIKRKRCFDVKENSLDISKIYKDSGWRPNIKIEQGIKMTYEWLLENYP
jgi:UDP-glucose 4-epimerase